MTSILNADLISGSNQHMVSQLVSITRMRWRDWAEWILENEDWNLDRAITWFHNHKNDIEYKDRLETEDELNEKRGIL